MTLFLMMVREAGDTHATAVDFAHDFTVGMDLARDFQKKMPTATVTLKKVKCEPVIEYEVHA